MTFAATVLVSCVFILHGVFAKEWTPIVSTKLGKVRGLLLKDENGNDCFAYRAIPYGKSTAGLLRFKPPQPVEPWDEVFDATSFGPECVQFNIVTRGIEGSEDCLVLNVYTPQLPNGATKEGLPVLVFIHGGGFSIGTGSYPFYGPQRFTSHGIVLVTLNYRLGPLGFLSTEDEASPGNYGMLDQVLALRWVKENIASFGGNPKKITIFGESAGSASVIYHMLSPLSKGLFHRAIAQSGTPVNHWGNQKHPLQLAKTVAGMANCPTNSTEILIGCLREKSLYDLLRPLVDMQRTPMFPIYYSPTVERSGGHGFLTEDPLELLRTRRIVNKVPLIIGLTELEMFSFYHDLMKPNRYKGQEHLDKEFPVIMDMLFNMDPYDETVFPHILKEYFKDSDVNDADNFHNVLQRLMGDATFGVGIAQTADLMANAGIPTWAYMYKHAGSHGLCELSGIKPGKYASHGDEFYIQFPFFYTQLLDLNEKDKRMAHIMNSLWSHFANGDNLTIAIDGESIGWNSYNPQNPSYLELSLQPRMTSGKLCDKVTFWSETLPKYFAKKE